MHKDSVRQLVEHYLLKEEQEYRGWYPSFTVVDNEKTGDSLDTSGKEFWILWVANTDQVRLRIKEGKISDIMGTSEYTTTLSDLDVNFTNLGIKEDLSTLAEKHLAEGGCLLVCQDYITTTDRFGQSTNFMPGDEVLIQQSYHDPEDFGIAIWNKYGKESLNDAFGFDEKWWQEEQGKTPENYEYSGWEPGEGAWIFKRNELNKLKKYFEVK